MNVPLFDRFLAVLKSASSFIDTRLLLHEKGVLNDSDTHRDLEGEIESSMSLMCKYYSKIVHSQEKYSNTVDKYKLPSSISTGSSVKKTLRFNE